MWSRVDLYSMYWEGGGFKYSRRTLIKFLVDYFRDDVVLLSSPDLASILAFKKYCYCALQCADDDVNKNLRIVAVAGNSGM